MSLLLSITSGTVTVNIIDAGGIASSGAIGEPSVTSTLNIVDAGNIASSGVIGDPAVTSAINVIDAGDIASSGAIGEPTVTEGSAVNIVDAGDIPTSGAIGEPTVTESVTPVVVERAGGGRYIGYLPPYEKKKPVVTIQWTDDKEQELIALLRKIDEDFEKKRAQQFRELLELLRTAIYLGNEVSISGFDYLKEQDLIAAKRKLQQEEEEILLLVA